MRLLSKAYGSYLTPHAASQRLQQRLDGLRRMDWQVLAQVLDPAWGLQRLPPGGQGVILPTGHLAGLLETSPVRILRCLRRLQGLGILVPGTRAGRRLTWGLDAGFGVGLSARRLRHHRAVLRLWAQAELEAPSRDPLTRDLLDGMNDIERALAAKAGPRLATLVA